MAAKGQETECAESQRAQDPARQLDQANWANDFASSGLDSENKHYDFVRGTINKNNHKK